MITQNLLYKKEIAINDSIKVVVPTVGDIVDNEDSYYGLVSIFTAMPIDMMCQLDDVGIDFTTINEYELFLLMFPSLKTEDTSLIFGDLDLSKFEMAVNEQNDTIVLIDTENDIKIDRAILNQIANALRKIHHLEKDIRKPIDGETKRYLIDRAKAKLKRHRNRKQDSNLESLIVALVNTEEFKYNYESVRDLSIYQFNESLQQIITKVDYNNRMHGVYAGTISVKDLSQKDLNWLTHK